MSTTKVWKSTVPLGKGTSKSPRRSFKITATDFTQVEQAVPVPIIYGTIRTAGTNITPIFEIKRKKHEDKKGLTGTTEYTYSGSIVIALSARPIAKLTAIRKSGDQNKDIWAGDLDQSSMDAEGKSTLHTTIGNIDFFWGTATQQPSSYLQTNFIVDGDNFPIPGLKRIAYAVLKKVEFGHQTTPPSLLFEFQCEVDPLTNGDSQISEIIEDVATNTFYGGALDPSKVDATSFASVMATLQDEDIGVSPLIDQTGTERDLIGQLLQYVDGFIYRKQGKLHIGLVRETDTTGLELIDEHHMLDEPQCDNEGIDSTWNFTRVTFTDRNNEFESSVVAQDNPANADMVGETVDKQFDMPFASRQSVAKQIARRFSFKGSNPALIWTIKLLPSLRRFNVGERLKMSFAKLGVTERVIRIVEVTIGGPHSPEVEIRAVDESAMFHVEHQTDPPDVDPPGHEDFEFAPAVLRLSTLTTPLKDGKEDGVLILASRGSNEVIGCAIYFTWDPVQQEYGLLATFGNLPVYTKTIFWHRIREDAWLLRVKPVNADELDDLLSTIGTAVELYFASGKRYVQTRPALKNEHQVQATLGFKPSGGYTGTPMAGVVDIEVRTPAFEAEGLKLETDKRLDPTPPDSVAPTRDMFIARRPELFAIPSNIIEYESTEPNAPPDPGTGLSPDTDLKRWFKAPRRTVSDVELLADAVPNWYDRDLTTMCPDGTFLTDWGNRAPTTYEVFDRAAGFLIDRITTDPDQFYITDLDSALGAVYAGAENATQFLLTEDINKLLAHRIDVNFRVYSPA